MAQDNSVTKDDLVAALVERIKSGGADALGFDALLKERAAEQWSDLRKEAIDGFVDKKVQEAMKGYISRVFQVAGLIGILLLGTFAVRLYNMTQSADIAQQVISQLKNDKKSEISIALDGALRYISELKDDTKEEYRTLKSLFDTSKADLNALKGEINSFSDTRGNMKSVEKEIVTVNNDLVRIKIQMNEDKDLFSALQGVANMTKEQIKKSFSELNEAERKKMTDLLSSLIPLEDAQLRTDTCDPDYDQINTFRYKNTTTTIPEVTAIVCLNKKQTFLGPDNSALKKTLGAN
jgi:hypothetical protein